ncbi:hypothetical protein GCM10009007_03520 [Formosimonas limnophila]|uniref:Uncharacterized protein n=1 Tax=Formosimonas limnophila TaxID=1384487 RepID=A0A8J3CG13_9BURK|nr:hypothetical protein [Formosimonas limnophila]GHA66341.1 hypothetical protein GCM10009007_03520 [Formosimonas limnophila]
MALTQEQRDEIKDALNIDTLDTYASDPDSLIEQMTPAQLLEGLKCGTLSLEQLNYLFWYGFMATEKALSESKKYTDSQINTKANLCNSLSPRAGNLLQIDPQPDGSCKLYYGTVAEQDSYYVDPNLGSDLNIGTRIAPLKSIKEAFSRIPENSSNVTVYLKSDLTHYVRSSEVIEVRANVTVQSYSVYNDSVKASWNEPASGWGAYGAQSWQRAKISCIADLPLSSNPSQSIGVCFIARQKLDFLGVTFEFPFATNPPVNAWQKAILTGGGIIGLVDCVVLNNNPNWRLISSAVGGLSPTVDIVALAISTVNDLFDLSSGGLINMSIGWHGATATNPSGMPYHVGNDPSFLKDRAFGDKAPQPQSENYRVTLSL